MKAEVIDKSLESLAGLLRDFFLYPPYLKHVHGMTERLFCRMICIVSYANLT
jgi:hypothetical protein